MRYCKNMTPELHHLISTYGYWLMAFGALIEGETFLVAGGIAAHQGIFKLEGLILLALVGSTVHDVFFFMVGRFFGHKIIQYRPQYFAKVEGLLSKFEKYGVWVIVGLRFAYGLRTIIPAVLGMCPLSFKKFLFFDLIGGIIWSSTFILGGYFFGAVIEHFLVAFDLYSKNTFYAFVGLSVVVLTAGYFIWKKYRKHNAVGSSKAK